MHVSIDKLSIPQKWIHLNPDLRMLDDIRKMDRHGNEIGRISSDSNRIGKIRETTCCHPRESQRVDCGKQHVVVLRER